MPPLAEPTTPAPRCPNCGAELPEPKPALCPNCGASLRARPQWQMILAALGAGVLTLVGLGLGGFGACVALFSSAETGSAGLFSAGSLWIWGCIAGGLLCLGGALFLIFWLMRKPK